MRRTTGASGSSHAHLQNQLNIAQRDEPITRPLPEQSDAPKPSGQSSIGRQGKKKDNIRSRQLQKQLKEAKEAEKAKEAEAVKAQARELAKQFQKYFAPIPSLKEKFGSVLQKALNDFEHFNKREALMLKAETPQDKELQEKLAIAHLNRAIKYSSDAISTFDESTNDGVNIFNRINSELESFDSLSNLPNKDRLYAADPDLKVYVGQIQAYLAGCRKEKAYASYLAIRCMISHVKLEHNRIVDNFNVLDLKMTVGDYSDSVRSDVEKTIAEVDKLNANFITLIGRENEEIESCDKLLADPHLHEELKNDIKKYRRFYRFTISGISLYAATNVHRKIYLLVSLLMHDNSKQQGHEDLKEWHESIKSLMVEYQSVVAVNTKLRNEEANEYMAPGSLSQDDLSVRLQAATEGPNQFEKIIRTCERRAAEYDNLKQVVKDERLTPLLKEMAAKAVDCMRNREYAAQMWSDKILELERKRSAQASFLPSSSSQPVQEKIFHRTTEGIVVGSINQKGGLDGLNETGKIISTYFKDEDSGDWVRDYSDESEPAAPAQSTEPAAPQEKTTVREKAERLIQKARNIEEASKRFAQKTHALVQPAATMMTKQNF